MRNCSRGHPTLSHFDRWASYIDPPRWWLPFKNHLCRTQQSIDRERRQFGTNGNFMFMCWSQDMARVIGSLKMRTSLAHGAACRNANAAEVSHCK